MKLPSPRTEPASERTSPLKAISFSSSVPAARRVMQRDAAGSGSKRSIASDPRLNFPLDAGQSILPCGSRPRSSAMPLIVSSGGAPFPAHQRSQAELDIELVGADLAEIVGAADHHRAQPQRRGRQQTCIELARDAHRRADHPRRLGLELRPELIPVDKYGPISAAISAIMKAIDSPSSVVCTGSPFEHVPVRWPPKRHDAVIRRAWRAIAMVMQSHPPAAALKSAPDRGHIIRPTVAKSQQHRATA